MWNLPAKQAKPKAGAETASLAPMMQARPVHVRQRAQDRVDGVAPIHHHQRPGGPLRQRPHPRRRRLDRGPVEDHADVPGERAGAASSWP